MRVRFDKHGHVIHDRPSPQEECWQAAVAASTALARVEARLVAAGALIELRQLQGLSAAEQDVLIHRELHEPYVFTVAA